MSGGGDAFFDTGGTGGGGLNETGGGGGGAGQVGGAGGSGDPSDGGATGGLGGASAGASGGAGGHASFIDVGGGGGGGGAHGFFGQLPGSAATGGGGGAGGAGSGSGAGGGGGAGGWGAVIGTEGGPLGTLGVAVSGGGGGAGGSGGQGGQGGTGGYGLYVLVPGSSLTIGSTVSGGQGGVGGVGTSANGAAGAGGAGIVGQSLALTLNGTVSGGLSGDGVTRADAIQFIGDVNRLTLGAGGSVLGDISVGGSLELLQATDETLASAITGSGSISKTGAGTLILTADSTYAGTTTITAGTLQIGNGGTTGSLGSGAVVNNAALAFNLSTASDIANDISGTGSVNITRAGRIRLDGANSYEGGTVVTNGTVEVASDGALGAATGGLTLDGGTLIAGGSFVSARAISLGSGGANNINVVTGAELSLSGAISGAGSLALNGGGTVILSGTNTYLGSTAVNGGTVSIAADGALGSTASTLYLNGGGLTTTATFTMARTIALQSDADFKPDAGTTLTLSGPVTDGSGLIMSGAGTLVLAGANSYGTTTISSGTLQVGAGGTTGTLGSGAVTNNAALVFNRTDTMTVSNAISGTGTVEQAGSGTTILTGTNTYSGGTTISGGTLQVGDGGATGSLGSGAVVNNGSLVFQRDGSPTFSNVISGTGSVVIERTTTLSGANTYMGGTVIKSYLYVGSDGAMGNATGGLTFDNGFLDSVATFSTARPITIQAGGAVFEPYAGTTLTLAGTISGSGGLGSNGPGSLVITGTNSYTGATVIGGGITRISSDAAFGNSSRLYVNGGSLQTTADMTMTRTVEVQSLGGAFVPDAGTTLTLAGAVVGGNFTLTKEGAGTLALTGTNTYRATTITAGTLQIGNGGTTGTLGTGAVTNNATLAFNRSNSITVANAISGTGGVTQMGTGTTILTGTNTYSGTTTISGGLLQVGEGSTTGSLGSGNVVNNAALAFNRSDAVTLSQLVSGTGTLTQAGTGNLIVTGTHSYTGATFVNAGRLSVNGSIVSSSLVTVADGGTLGGTGSLPGTLVQSGGTLAPGNSIGTLNVAGNLTLAAGSITQIEVEGPLIDRINVTGTASLGGTLRLLAQGGSYTFNSPYTIIQAGAVTGKFAAVDTTGSFGAGITSEVTTTATEALLTLVPVPLAPIVTPEPPPESPPDRPRLHIRGTVNQTTIAAGLDRAVTGGADVSSLFNLYNLPLAALPRGLDQVSGQIHAVAPGMHARPAQQFMAAILDPARRPALGDGADGAAPRYQVWAGGFGGGGRIGSSGNPGTYAATASGGGVAVGVDMRLNAQMVAGLALAGSGGMTRLADGMGRAESNQLQGAVYGKGSFGALQLSGALAFGGMDVITRRGVPFLGRGELHGRYTSAGVSTRLEAGWQLAGLVSGVTLTPALAFQGSWYRSPNFTETGAPGVAAAALAVSGRNTGQSRMEVSLRADMTLSPQLTAYGRLGWAAYLQRDAGMSASFAGLANSGFSVSGARPDAHAALVSGGLDWQVAPAVTLSARLDAELAGNGYAVNGTARITYAF